MRTTSQRFEDGGGFLQTQGTRTTKRRGAVLFHEGSTSDTVSYIVSGQIKVLLHTPTGKDLVLAIKQPGEFVGELAALDDRSRSATAIATTDCELLQLTAAQFLAYLELEPKLAIDLLRRLSSQLRLADERTANRNSADTLTRLARCLSQLHDTIGQHDRRRDRMTLLLSHEDLAGWIGASREATSRSMGVLRRAGCIETGRERVHIIDVTALRSFA